jgi:hypothetical protein
MNPRSRMAIRAVLFATVSLLATTAAADYSIYEEGDRKVDFKLTVVGAQFMNTDSWFGESENFLGGNTDDWAEVGAEPGVAFRDGSRRRNPVRRSERRLHDDRR